MLPMVGTAGGETQVSQVPNLDAGPHQVDLFAIYRAARVALFVEARRIGINQVLIAQLADTSPDVVVKVLEEFDAANEENGETS